MSFLISDKDIDFPHYVVLKASAGAGKTTALTRRYVQFLLSERIPNNKLKNILAITFSNNAAQEMKERILKVLKKLYQKDENTIKDFSTLLNIDQEKLSLKAKEAIEEILNNYSDFQVKTIDSFMTTLFKASSTDFGYTPDFGIIMNDEELITYAFEFFMQDMKEGSEALKNLINAVELITDLKGYDSTYLWDPATKILQILREFYSLEGSSLKKFSFEKDLLDQKKETERLLKVLMGEIIFLVDSSGLEKSGSCKIYDEFPTIIEKGEFQSFLKKKVTKLPVKKPKSNKDLLIYEQIQELWEQFKEVVEDYIVFYAKSYFFPYEGIFRAFKDRLEKVKQREEKIFINEINGLLAKYIKDSNIPDIYFKLAEKVYHFLIDEFQDTSPLQWHNLRPLIENALSTYGSLFVVGDTKQAIYKFRNADYRIMKELENIKVFPSATKIVTELDRNYRSGGKIVEFNEEIFKKRLPENDTYKDATLSGLTDFKQIPLEEKRDQGYVELKSFNFVSEEKDVDDQTAEEELKRCILDILKDLKDRGYSYSDIAVLGYQNSHITMLSQWINENKIEILSYSNLDVRKRKISDELFHLLKFLDSPLDDFSFSVFLKGNIYSNYLTSLQPDVNQFLLKYRDSKVPLYKAFEEEYPDIWKRDFSELFKLTGYLPLYDLLSIAISKFRVFETIPEEEATFIKFLELITYFEGMGYSSIKDFADFFTSRGEDEKIWNLSMPTDIDAVRLMTIHKAKGLEFPVVIFYMHNRPNTSEKYYPFYEGDTFYILRINNDIAERSTLLKQIKDIYDRESKIDRLNVLYVALTRAEQELYVISPPRKKNGAPTELIFNDRKTGEGFIRNCEFFGNKPTSDEVNRMKSKKRELSTEKFMLTHSLMKEEFVAEKGEIHIEEKKRGELIHEVLSCIDYLESYTSLPDKIKERINKLNSETVWKISYDEIDKILKTLFNSSLKKYFVPTSGRTVKNEIELTDSFGNLYRLDRLVIDTHTVTVIDYKTGHLTEEEHLKHKEQIKNYKALVSEIYKERFIKGFLYYVDIGRVVEI
jgi:ATP-dependent exoDNAse (exonuclease V) beta subunit